MTVSKHVDILEVRARFLRKGEDVLAAGGDHGCLLFGLDGKLVELSPDSELLEWEESKRTPEHSDPFDLLYSVKTKAELWLFELAAIGEGEHECALNHTVDAVGWEELFAVHGLILIRDAASERTARRERAIARMPVGWGLEGQRQEYVEDACSRVDSTPMVFVAAVETTTTDHGGDDIVSTCEYLGRIDTKRLGEVLRL